MTEFVVSDMLVTNYCQEAFTTMSSQESWPGMCVVPTRRWGEETLMGSLCPSLAYWILAGKRLLRGNRLLLESRTCPQFDCYKSSRFGSQNSHEMNFRRCLCISGNHGLTPEFPHGPGPGIFTRYCVSGTGGGGQCANAV